MDRTTTTDATGNHHRTEPPMTVNAAGKALADQHWQYIVDLLRIHVSDWDQDELAQLEFHYKTAMIHGYKHGVDDRERAFESEAPEEAVD